ncbi:Protein CBG27660 [Caenorhabditis briggsae]|uniref:Protein CBG27660 n=1 Tax=Caenorhabditis briggsae TaxID=6238 RepID=B6IJA5_CAEBR|nr:Protein CBG27660 [Caenorhabditis briggsae]CAR99939.1 Protein CBG27660 [Caenorhabditis briggsae]
MLSGAFWPVFDILDHLTPLIIHQSMEPRSCKCGSWNCSGLVGKEENVQVKRNGSQEKRQITTDTNFKQLGLGGTVGNLMQVNPRKFEKENRATDTANLRDTFLKVLKNDPELTNEMKKTILSNEHCQHSE